MAKTRSTESASETDDLDGGAGTREAGEESATAGAEAQTTPPPAVEPARPRGTAAKQTAQAAEQAKATLATSALGQNVGELMSFRRTIRKWR